MFFQLLIKVKTQFAPKMWKKVWAFVNGLVLQKARVYSFLENSLIRLLQTFRTLSIEFIMGCYYVR
jgi:hypothetical protein